MPDLMVETLGNVLDVVSAADCGDNYRSLLAELWNASAGMSWKIKSKYPPLAIVAPRIGVQKVSQGGRCWVK